LTGNIAVDIATNAVPEVNHETSEKRKPAAIFPSSLERGAAQSLARLITKSSDCLVASSCRHL
jgi:hypothetical protein